MVASDDGPAGGGRPTKVAHLIEEYDLEPLGDELVAAWTADGDERRSLRELAEYFNRQLLGEAMRTAGLQTVDGEPENLHRLLTDGDVGGADRTRARRKLAREGVDVEDLLEDFVSYQAVRTYLREDRDAEYSRDGGERATDTAETVQRLRGRTAAVVADKVEQLRTAGDLDVGEFRTIVDVSVVCESCGEQYAVSDLLDRGTCRCEDDG